MGIRVDSIFKRYGKYKVLEDISFSFEDERVIGILGPNGAGKSTLLMIIAGMEMEDAGRVVNDGRVVNFLDRRKLIAYMGENMRIYPDFFVSEFIFLYRKITSWWDEELVERFELYKVYDKKIKELSRGWHQKLKIYSVFSMKKNIFVLDEPFDGLDPLETYKLIELIKRYVRERNITFFLSMHELYIASRICDYVVLLNCGKKILSGSLSWIYSQTNTNDLEKIFMDALKMREN